VWVSHAGNAARATLLEDGVLRTLIAAASRAPGIIAFPALLEILREPH
jgi:hypothetical protein